jgi:hypothetical protein
VGEIPPNLYPFYVLIVPSVDKSVEYIKTGEQGGRSKRGDKNNPSQGPLETLPTKGAFDRDSDSDSEGDMESEGDVEGEVDKPPSSPVFPFEEYRDIWKNHCPSLPCPTDPKNWTDTRKRRLKEKGLTLEEWADLCKRIEDSDFLSGRSGKWSGCSLDWILKPENWAKLMEGHYDNRDKRQRQFTSVDNPEEPMFDILDEVIN